MADRYLIVTPCIEGSSEIPASLLNSTDLVICADGGYETALMLGLEPSFWIGDADSLCKGKELPESLIEHRLPKEKDLTDTEAAVKAALKAGADEIVILGGLGGRLDHTMGNLGLLEKYGSLCSITIEDGINKVRLVNPGKVNISKDRFKYMGLVAFTDRVEALTLRNVKYPLNNFLLEVGTTLGVSNEIIGESCEIEFKSGKLLIIQSNDRT